MSAPIELAIILLLILLNAVFALSEMAMVSARRARLALLEQKGVRGAGFALHLSEDPQRFLPTVQVGITLVSILAGSFGGSHMAARLATSLTKIPQIAPFAGEIALTVVVIAITFVTLVLGELVPKQLALRWPERIAASVARPLLVVAKIGAPFVWLLNRASRLVLRLFGPEHHTDHAVTEDELKHMLTEGAEAGVFERVERDMIERLLRLADKPVRAIMTPRNELAWIDRTDPQDEIIRNLTQIRHSRFVVCDGEVDNPVGVILAKDVLDRLLMNQDLQIEPLLRKTTVIPDTVTALETLNRLKADALGLALVMDEYGSFEGVVTASDVLGAIVGEAETTPTPEDGAGQQNGAFLIDGPTPVDELKSLLQLTDLPASGSYHTAAGLMLASLRRVPRIGETIVFAGWRFEVTEMDGRRVSRIRATRDPIAE